MESLTLIALLIGGASIATMVGLFDDDDNTSATDEPPEDDGDGEDPDDGEDPGGGEDPDGTIIFGTEGNDDLNVTGSDTRRWSFTPVNSLQGRFVQDIESGDIFSYVHRVSEVEFTDHYGEHRFDILPDLTLVQGLAGNDTITLSGEDLLVFSADGADLIDASKMGSGMILASEGDTVTGSDIADVNISRSGEICANFQVYGDNMTFEGGAAPEAAMLSRASDASGGGGDDTLYAWAEARLSGDEGNDALFGNYPADQYLGRDTPHDVSSYSNHCANLLDGGAGSDRIEFDNEDTVTGGEGADTLMGYMVETTPTDPDNPGALITDFDPAKDSLTLYFDVYAEGGSTIDDVTMQVQDGDTLIRFHDQVVARIQGLTDLTIGSSDQDPDIVIKLRA